MTIPMTLAGLPSEQHQVCLHWASRAKPMSTRFAQARINEVASLFTVFSLSLTLLSALPFDVVSPRVALVYAQLVAGRMP